MYVNVGEYAMTTDAMGYMPKVFLRASSMNGNMSAKKGRGPGNVCRYSAFNRINVWHIYLHLP